MIKSETPRLLELQKLAEESVNSPEDVLPDTALAEYVMFEPWSNH